MTRAPSALVVVDGGAATTAVALLGRPRERWRLLGSLAVPAGAPEADLVAVLASRVAGADPELAEAVGLADGQRLGELPRLASRSAPPRTLAVLGASRRAVALLEQVAARTGWRVQGASTESHDPREMTELALRTEVSAVLVAAGDPPGPDERAALDDLASLVAAVARRRPELRVILGGSLRGRRAWTEGLGDDPGGEPGRIVEAPSIGSRREPDEGLRAILDGLLDDPLDGRRAVRAAVASLADLLDRRIELFEVGHDGGARVVAAPGAAGEDPATSSIVTARGALVPPDPDDAIVDQVLGWTAGSQDRHRMGDRLRDLRSVPWADATGDGARLRLAAARAALARIAAATPELAELAPADVTIVAGGAFAAAPPAAVALALADTVRRTGATQIATDPARLLGPIGTIEDPAERRALLADVAADLLVPLGSMVLAAGLGARRDDAPVGRLLLEHGEETTRHELSAGELAFLDLPPGTPATATFEFRETARLGRRTRHVAVPVSGGIAGLLVDLRDIPLRLPDRRDRRRAVLGSWAGLAWPGDDR
ncbi:MAG TPA: hypothetical protein VFO50_03985 [Candidatus Limnocylindrales bacterium]|nr:hypothetical protein [Candidatus Limnocylindrales bacterium]